MTIAQAMSLYTKELVKSAVKKEMTNMVEKNVFKRISLKESSSIPEDLIIPSKRFIKDKENKELKARFVGGGHRQSERVYERKSSPTVGAATIFIAVVDTAHKNKCNGCTLCLSTRLLRRTTKGLYPSWERSC